MLFPKKIKQTSTYTKAREWKKVALIYMRARSDKHFKYSFPSLQEFAYVYREIFQWKEYEFHTNKKNPVILDCGSHIGISVLYFKMLYPKAHIIAFEPTPNSFKYLQKNLEQNRINDVKVVNAALAKKEGRIPFYVAKNTHGRFAWSNSGVKHHEYDRRYYDTIYVPTVKLSTYITKRVDLIKMDIEWMEMEVMKEIESKLYLVNEIVFDFHGSEANPIEKLLRLLKKNYFSYIIFQGKQIDEKDIEKTKNGYSLVIHAKRNTNR